MKKRSWRELLKDLHKGLPCVYGLSLIREESRGRFNQIFVSYDGKVEREELTISQLSRVLKSGECW